MKICQAFKYVLKVALDEGVVWAVLRLGSPLVVFGSMLVPVAFVVWLRLFQDAPLVLAIILSGVIGSIPATLALVGAVLALAYVPRREPSLTQAQEAHLQLTLLDLENERLATDNERLSIGLPRLSLSLRYPVILERVSLRPRREVAPRPTPAFVWRAEVANADGGRAVNVRLQVTHVNERTVAYSNDSIMTEVHLPLAVQPIDGARLTTLAPGAPPLVYRIATWDRDRNLVWIDIVSESGEVVDGGSLPTTITVQAVSDEGVSEPLTCKLHPLGHG